MHSNIQIFKHKEFCNIRTMSGEHGEPLFCGKDVAEALGYGNPQKAIRDHVFLEDKGVNEMGTQVERRRPSSSTSLVSTPSSSDPNWRAHGSSSDGSPARCCLPSESMGDTWWQKPTRVTRKLWPVPCRLRTPPCSAEGLSDVRGTIRCITS